MKTANLIVYLCVAIIIIVSVYNFLIVKDLFSGIIWLVLGIIFLILGYKKL